jgi:hypothetical protein
MKKQLFLALLASLSLLSCGSAADAGYVDPATNATSNSTSTYTRTSTRTTTATSVPLSDKQKVINYLNAKGTMSNGYMTVGKGSKTIDGAYTYTYISMMYYNSDNDTFNLVHGDIQVETSTNTQLYLNLASAIFYWGSYKRGAFLTSVTLSSTYAYDCDIDNISFGSTGTISNYTLTMKSNTFPSSTDTSNLMTLSQTEADNLNIAINWYGTLGLPSLI